MSSSEDERDAVSEADEQWDDMAIVRVHRTTCTNAAMKFVDAQRTDLTLAFMYYQLAQAFEDALNDQRQRSRASTKVQKAKSSHSARKQLRRVPVDEEDTASSTTPAAAASPGYGYTPTNPSGYQQSFAAQSQPQSQANGYAIPSASEHGSQNDIYQLAYAQAYASLQAQFQTAAHQPSPSQYPTGYGYGAQQAPGYPSRPSQHFQPQMPPSMPMPPFPSVPGVNAMPGASDDGLSNLLLAWYQSGYYTGRFQAIQEMKARNHR